MRQLVLSLTALSALVLLAACHGVQTPLLTKYPVGQEPPAEKASALAPAAPTGGATLRIKWPDRTSQYIQGTATKIVFGVYQAGITAPIATGSVTRPASDISFQPLPIGSLRFTADALDPDGTVGASGSATVLVLPNATVSVPLHLASAIPAPTLSGFTPANGVPGQQVTVTGANFGESRGMPFAVKYGNTSVPSDRAFRLSDTQLAFFVPASALNSTFTVTIGGQSAATVTPFRVIATVSVTPVTGALTSGSPTATLTVTATDSAGVPVGTPTLAWRILSEVKTQGGTVDQLLSFDSATGLVTRGTATGSATIGIGLAPVLATASFTVN